MANYSPYDAFGNGYLRMFSNNAVPNNGMFFKEGQLPGLSFAEMHPDTGDARAITVGILEKLVSDLKQKIPSDVPNGFTVERNNLFIPSEGVFRVSYTVTADYQYTLGQLPLVTP